MSFNLNPLTSSTRQHGFSMIEILITLVLIAVAMLGTAGLQLNAMRLNKGSQLRTQVIFLASDITERMEANKVQAVAGTYAVPLTSVVSLAGTNCETAACDGTALAAWDINRWGQSIAALLPQSRWSITRVTAGNPSTYNIVIDWVDRSDVRTIDSGAIRDSYTATRTIGN